MRKIWKFDVDGMKVAWIGESAPVPEDWHTNEQNAKDAHKFPPAEEKAEVTGGFSRKRGRGRKG